MAAGLARKVITSGVVGAVAVLGATGAAQATRPAHVTQTWHKTRIVTTGTNSLVGPFIARTPAGKIVAEYADSKGDGTNTTTLSWRTLGPHGWSRPVAAATGAISGRAVSPAVAASNNRVASLRASAGSSGLTLTLIEQTTGGKRVFARTLSRSIGGGRSISVALDKSNNAVVLAVAKGKAHSTITAWHVTAAGKVSALSTLQAVADPDDDTPLTGVKVVTIGANRFVAAWLAANSTNNNSVIHTATFTGRWSAQHALAAAGSAVVDYGFTSNGAQALLSYLTSTNTSTGAVALRASVETGGHWGVSRLVAKKPGIFSDQASAVASNGTGAIVAGATYTLAPKATAWRAGPAAPVVFPLCGGTSLASSYETNLLHWFFIGSTKAGCTMADYTEH